jgi:polyisoprenoid-binding protein YceI
MKKVVVLFLAFCMTGSLFAQQKLTPVDAESKVHFVVRNFGINTGGQLTGLKGKIIFDKNNLNHSSFDVSVDVFTVDTDNSRRDKHLKSADYFDIEKYPGIHIKGKPAAGAGGGYLFKGELTIKDVTRPIEFPFSVKLLQEGFLFEGEFEINRLDFHVGESSKTLSDNVKVDLKVMAK